jgi:Calx-beta domain/Purple acid Phosphatase, N-terminal domain
VHAGSAAIVTSAQTRGVPIVSAKQMLDWLDGRNLSTFGSVAWSGSTLSFTVGVGTGANGLRGLVPTASRSGPITGITRDGTAVSFTTQAIKGVDYAMFTATAGNYQVQYAVDTTPPAISAVTAVAGTTSATVSWTTDEPATSVVNYGLTPTSLTSSASAAGFVTGHEVPLTGLTAGTQYYYRVTSADAATNSASAPTAPATFTTNSVPPPGAITVSDSTAADFAGGTGPGTYVSVSGNGEVILAPTVGAEFSGSALPTGWSSAVWNTGGAAVVASGLLTVDGARANADALFGPGRALDFVATFGTEAFQHVGFGVTFNETPWAMFSTGTGGSLFARTHTGATPTDTLIPGNWLNAPHDFRIEWNASSVVFLIDGGVVATHAVTIDTNMRPIASDFSTGGNTVTVNWMRMSPYTASATFDSRVLDAGASTQWGSADWTAITPANTSVALSARFGDTPATDGTWTGFVPLSAPGTNNLSQTSRYLQYRAVLTSTAAALTPSLNDITFTAAAGAIPPGISIADVSVNEGDTGQTNAVVTLTLSASTSSSVTVQYATADGTAAATTDYPGASGTATFAPNATTTTITIPVNGDTTVEPNETFFVNLSSPVNGTITDGQGIVTIVNDDSTLSEFTIGNATVTEGNTGSILATFTVTLTPARTTGSATVTYQTVDGTATAGSDYSATSATLTFAAGVTTQTLTVPVLGDTLDEANETFLVRLSAPVGAAIGTPSQGTGTITDNDALPSFRINDVSVTEGNAGTVAATFTVTLSAASGRATSVNYATGNGTATAASGDYVATSGTLSFPAGTTSQQVSVTINGDLLNENNETVNLNLSGATNATIADSRGIATIINDDGLPTVSIADAAVMEGNSGTRNVTFTVTLSAASGKSVTINYATANGTASSGSDYVAKTGSVTFSAGQTTKNFNVSIVNDRVGEETETFLVNLTGATNATIADGQAVCTITDNDAPIEAP